MYHIHRLYAGQVLWVWTVSLPVIILNSPKVTDGQAPSFGQASDILGIIIWAIGWLIESIADLQKFQYKSTRPPKEKPIDVSVLNVHRIYADRKSTICVGRLMGLVSPPSILRRVSGLACHLGCCAHC